MEETPLNISDPNGEKDHKLPEDYLVHKEVYDRLQAVFEGISGPGHQQETDRDLRISDVIDIYRSNRPNLCHYAFYSYLTDEYEQYQLHILQNLSRYAKWVLLKKRIIRIVVKL